MSIRDGLIIAGIIILVIVLADLIRRYLRRNKLRLEIDEQFKDFPAADLSSELPNGGARVVSNPEHPPLQISTSTSQAEVDAGGVEGRPRMDAEATLGKGTAAGRNAQPEAWVIDPRLSGSREPDVEVDLLLELEFKGLGEGAGRWLSQTEAVPAAGLDVGAAEAEEAESADAEAVAGPEPKAAINSLELVADAELIDLERPVHELLQARQQATLSSPEPDAEPAKATAAVSEKRTEKSAEKAEEQGQKTASASVSAAAKPRFVPAQQPSLFEADPGLAPAVDPSAHKPKSRRRRKKAEQLDAAVSAVEATPETALEDEVLIINVLSKRMPFSGPPLFKLVDACGMEFGERGIYHRYEQANGQGALQFSMANAVQPGSFDPSQTAPWSTPAVTFFLCLADPVDRMNALECMLATAKCVADNLGGDLKDEHRSSLRTQTIEHYRQKVREFERKTLTRRR